jgi:2'-phosphotransferase
MKNSKDESLSKAIARLLRHNPPPEMDSSGWIPVLVLMQFLKYRVTLEEIRRVVEIDEKKRFILDEIHEPARIRAAQGHTIQLETPILERVTSAATIHTAVHVTSEQGWKKIQQSRELRRMSRTNIHFATRPVQLRKNHWANVFLLLKLHDALNDGYTFMLSSNNVLLCKGPLPLQYVQHVRFEDLPSEWR